MPRIPGLQHPASASAAPSTVGEVAERNHDVLVDLIPLLPEIRRQARAGVAEDFPDQAGALKP